MARRGQRVLLLDAYGPANARASSGGESRIIRMGYGPDEIYTRSAQNSYEQWQTFFASTGHHQQAERILAWLDAHRTRLGALPEQVDVDGRPVSVAPIAWTDAVVLLALLAQDHQLPVPPVPVG